MTNQAGSRAVDRGRAGWAGAVGAGLALGLTELAAGLFHQVPSAVAAVGGLVVDASPPIVKDVAIALLGTADKGALAIGTAILAVLIGFWVGRRSTGWPWLPAVAFSVFGLVGVLASIREPFASGPATVAVVTTATVAGWWAMRRLSRLAFQPGDAAVPSAARRRFLTGAAGLGVLAVGSGALGRRLIIDRSEQAIEDAAVPAATRPAPVPGPEHAVDVPAITPVVVPNDEFYRIDTALVVPRIDPTQWSLRVTGLVDRPLELTYDELVAMELEERYVTIACVSNEVGGDLVGNAAWTGVRLAEVLDRAGVRPGATQVVGRSVDGWTAGFPTQVVFDGREPLIALGMNGQPLPARHGYPARLIVPGLYGYVSATKWLVEIELTTWEDFDGYWIPRGWAKSGPIKIQSRIDYPRRGELISGNPLVAGGVAWAPLRGISAVQVRVDEGPWIDAEVTTPLSDAAWVQWRAEFTAPPGAHRLRVRAVDGDGVTQTPLETPPRPDGATGHHTIEFRSA